MNQNQFRKFSNIIQYRNVTALEEMLVTDLEVNSLFRCSTECEPSVDRTPLNMAVCALWMQDEKFPFQPQPVSASATSASAICFFTEYFLK